MWAAPKGLRIPYRMAREGRAKGARVRAPPTAVQPSAADETRAAAHRGTVDVVPALADLAGRTAPLLRVRQHSPAGSPPSGRSPFHPSGPPDRTDGRRRPGAGAARHAAGPRRPRFVPADAVRSGGSAFRWRPSSNEARPDPPEPQWHGMPGPPRRGRHLHHRSCSSPVPSRTGVVDHRRRGTWTSVDDSSALKPATISNDARRGRSERQPRRARNSTLRRCTAGR